MELTITIQMDNDAFQDNGEAPRILRELADVLQHTTCHDYESRALIDFNGQKVGSWKVML